MWSVTLYGHLIVVALQATSCLTYTGYEVFDGIEHGHGHRAKTTRTHRSINTIKTTRLPGFISPIKSSRTFKRFDLMSRKIHTAHKNVSPIAHLSTLSTVAVTNATTATSTTTIATTTPDDDEPILQTFKPLKQLRKTILKYNCSEDELPSSIGTYEVPSQRDLVLFTKKTLIRLFDSYHSKVLQLLHDIKEVAKAAKAKENKCLHKHKYHNCIKHVSMQFGTVTKSLVSSLEAQRHDVAAYTQGTICDMATTDIDPVQLVKTLAMEDISLEFALPAYLRLLNTCTAHCISIFGLDMTRKPVRHLTDHDLVIRYFLRRKNYKKQMNKTAQF